MKDYKEKISNIFKEVFGKKKFDDRNIQYSQGGICLKRKHYENQEMKGVSYGQSHN